MQSALSSSDDPQQAQIPSGQTFRLSLVGCLHFLSFFSDLGGLQVNRLPLFLLILTLLSGLTKER